MHDKLINHVHSLVIDVAGHYSILEVRQPVVDMDSLLDVEYSETDVGNLGATWLGSLCC